MIYSVNIIIHLLVNIGDANQLDTFGPFVLVLAFSR